MSTFTITTKVDVPVSRVADLVCCALEGGSTYWCEDFQPAYPPGVEWGHEAVAHGAPFSVKPDDDDAVLVSSGPKHIQRTLQLMADKHPFHWEEFMHENEDANTGDVFFQLLVFGEVVYG